MDSDSDSNSDSEGPRKKPNDAELALVGAYKVAQVRYSREHDTVVAFRIPLHDDQRIGTHDREGFEIEYTTGRVSAFKNETAEVPLELPTLRLPTMLTYITMSLIYIPYTSLAPILMGGLRVLT